MGAENNETITYGDTEALNNLLEGVETPDERRKREQIIKNYVKEHYPEDYEKYQNIVDNNTTEIADLKKQFEEEVLSNPDFSDGDIPETLQKQQEIISKMDDLMTMDKKQFLKEIHELNEGDLEDLLMTNQILNGNRPGRKKNKNILNRMEDIENLYYKKTGMDNNESSKNGDEIMYIYGKNGEKTPVDEFFTEKKSTKIDSHLGINEDNLPTDENGNLLTPDQM